jgi:Branched-chain amino acid aminotransferase/4-amino-4-deoxychorismate lyase
LSECLYKYFILNDQAKNCNEFDDGLLSDGKSLYEVIRIIDRKPLFLQRHLERLENSARLINVELWFTKDEIKEKLEQLIEENNITIGNIKFVFNVDNNIFLAYFVKHHYPSKDDYKNGVKTIFYHGERKNPNAKIINMGFREAVDKEIRDKNAYEAILVDRNGFITEGSKSNIFMIRDRKVITSPLEDVLPGITRNVIIEVCRKMGLEVLEEKVHYEDVKDLDGLFISGTSPEVLPISKVENVEFNSSQNEFVLKIMDGYKEARQAL